MRSRAVLVIGATSALVAARWAFGAEPGGPLAAVGVAAVAVCAWAGGAAGGLLAVGVGAAVVGVGAADPRPAAWWAAAGVVVSLALGSLRAEAGRAARRAAALEEREGQRRASGTATALQVTERHFHRLAASMPQILWAAPADGRPDYRNRTFFEPFGLHDPADLLPDGVAAVVHPDDLDAYRAAWAAALRSGQPGGADYRLRTAPGGAFRWHHGRFLPVRDEAGRVERWFCTSTDTDDQRRAAELARANETLRDELAERARAAAARDDLRRQLAAAQEAERSRIARELHDQMGQLLTALGVGLRVVRDETPPAEPTQARLAQLQALTEAIGREVHRLAVELRPSALDDAGLGAAVRNYAAGWAGRSGVEIDVLADGLDSRLPAAVATAAYRVVQEAITNVVKHSGAARASVVLRRAGGTLQVAVEDDGRGFDPDAAPAGRLGLVGMRERVAELGGTIAVESGPGGGTAVVVRLPLPPDATGG